MHMHVCMCVHGCAWVCMGVHGCAWVHVHVRPGEEKSGIFIYQSMSGRDAVSFEGEISFVPGSLRQPRGDEFQVAVARFPLVCANDEFIY